MRNIINVYEMFENAKANENATIKFMTASELMEANKQ